MRIGVAAVIAVLWSLPAASWASDCTAAYSRASDHYSSFIRSPAQKKYHERWESLAGEFEAVAEKYPDCHKADDALYMAGKLRFDCYSYSQNPDDLRAALPAFQALIAQYPDSTLADDAQFLRGRCFELMGDYDRGRIEYQRTIQRYRRGDMVRQAQAQLARLPQGSAPPAPKPAPVAPSPSPATPSAPVSPAPAVSSPGASPAQILTIRYWSSQDYTRVVVDLDREVDFLPPHLLKPDPNLGAPPRLYVDFPGTVLSPEFRQQTPLRDGFYDLPIGDGLLEKARAGQHDQDAVRVVLDLKSISDFHCFPLPGEDGGFRVVLDISGQKAAPPQAAVIPAPLEKPPAPAPVEKPAPAQKPAPKVQPKKLSRRSVIVIDPGHGGKDPGAIGPGRTREKDVTLALAKKLKARLEKEHPDLKVVLTRSDDRYLSLVERTALANTLDADLFISIHCNASPKREAAGIETYYLNNTTDRAALKLAARENFVPEKTMEKFGSPDEELNFILADMQTSSKVERSVPLAGLIQESMVRELKKEYSSVHDLGVKKAPFWVLTGARMPCVLVETSFISNRREEKRLVSSSFQDDLARAMARGIHEYLNEHPELAAAWGE